MGRSPRRILLAVEPGVFEGALAQLLRAEAGDEVVQVGRTRRDVVRGAYDAAVVTNEVPEGVSAHVVIALPDMHGSGGTGTVTTGDQVHEIGIWDAERIVELLDRYAPRHRRTVPVSPPVRGVCGDDGAVKKESSEQ